MASKRGNILAIDQGTTNTKVLLVDPDGSVMARATRPLKLRFPQPTWVEQDATAVWQSVREAIDECLTAVDDPRPAAIAVTNQREAVVLWERESG
jgi:glycerol kinase